MKHSSLSLQACVMLAAAKNFGIFLQRVAWCHLDVQGQPAKTTDTTVSQETTLSFPSFPSFRVFSAEESGNRHQTTSCWKTQHGFLLTPNNTIKDSWHFWVFTIYVFFFGGLCSQLQHHLRQCVRDTSKELMQSFHADLVLCETSLSPIWVCR